MQVHVNTPRCIGAGNCVMAAPDVFDQGEDDGLVILLQEFPADDQRAAVTRAAQLCPAAIIQLTEA